jgi:putative phosphoribosyl transferase
MTTFADRRDAGRRLGEQLSGEPVLAAASRVAVLGIPRGGLPVGAEVARALGGELDVVVVRKLRVPHHQELGFGAIGPDGRPELDESLISRVGLSPEQIDAEIADRREAVEERLRMYRRAAPEVALPGAAAVVVDDGIATGGTARQACAAAARLGADPVVLAVPVGPPSATSELADAADRVVVLSQPPGFVAVGQAYRDFGQLTDDDVMAVLREAARVRQQ